VHVNNVHAVIMLVSITMLVSTILSPSSGTILALPFDVSVWVETFRSKASVISSLAFTASPSVNCGFC